jgi:ABC-type sugar transport system ATPase subunit
MAALSIRNLEKRYPGTSDTAAPALRDFSLEVADGELVAIVGPSGCGKSTLLRMLAGLEAETAGETRLGERSLTGLAPKDRDLALMFQSYTLLPHLTVEENLAFGLKLRGEGKASRIQKARETARLLGIEPLLRRLPSEISGGERQRAALGRAILRSPSAFLFDEPLSSLDAQMRLQLRVEIQRLHRRMRVPMLFVTHDQSEALTLGDRVVVLNRGVMQQVATPEDLYRKPANAFVASFIGAPGMNLFRGTIARTTAGDVRFVSDALSFTLTSAQTEIVGSHSQVTVGIRPEHLRRSGTSQTSDGTLHGEVSAVERQAGQTTLYLHHDAVAFAARAGADFSVRTGDHIGWDFEPGDVCFFAGPDEARLEGIQN